MQIPDIIRDAIAGEIDWGSAGVVEFNPIRRAKRGVHQRALIAGDNFVYHEIALASRCIRTRKKQRQQGRGKQEDCDSFDRFQSHEKQNLTWQPLYHSGRHI
ncbi:hypothetical protein SDC9_207110 [bioreactor metagenome]|uniref:Uncharacterized protein n=1 Tax=bioreactor metagenome TaxID=1076179 RepID=A0A645J9J3_9ZZZZ